MLNSTLVIIKPDAVARGLIGEITSRFEKRGLFLCQTKVCKPTQSILQEHYKDLVTKPYFQDIIKSMTSGPVVVQVWYGMNAISIVRKMLGATDPQDAEPGTIRGDYAIHIGKNVCHASDSSVSANKEIKLWFPEVTASEWHDIHEMAINIREHSYRLDRNEGFA